jgi:5'(3')-deoxyribonucleotidase
VDGVLIDFMAMGNAISKMNLKEGELDTLPIAVKDEFWRRIVEHVNRGNPFFSNMELLPDAMELWKYITRHKHFILTAAGDRVPRADIEKRESVRKHFGRNVRVEVVESAKDKARYAEPHIILIDDRVKATDPFIKAGGMAILHTSAKDTIRQLQQLGL